MRSAVRFSIHHIGNILRLLKLTLYRCAGAKIGKNTMISLGAKIDCRRGRVFIGNDCHITYGCVILSHDGAAKQLMLGDGEGEVHIGHNVFIGVNSVILRNVTIGDNTVIGAGSVVSGNIPANVVVSGNPAKIRRSIDISLAPYEP